MHKPVLLNEVIKYLDPKPGENFIDCTVGEAGHSLAILQKTESIGKVLGIDADFESLQRIKPQDGFILVNGNFRDLKRIAEKHNFYPIDGILFDLGLSSWQIEESKRGFSFRNDEQLDMRFQLKTGSSRAETAEEIINQWPEKELTEIFKKYGEEKFSFRIAKGIVQERENNLIKTTGHLREIILKFVPYGYTRRGKEGRVLARIFQALRIAVNDELENLKIGLEKSLEILKPRGRIVVISFHSLEDRIVKNFFRGNESLKILTKKPIVASEDETMSNPRSRSAKLRAAIKS